MEIFWKITNFFIGVVLIGFCSGFPIGLENSAADYHNRFPTGLVGVLLIVCSVVFLAGCLCCRARNGFKEFHNNPVEVSSTTSLDHGHVNPIASEEFTIFTPLSPPNLNNNVFLANGQIIGQTIDCNDVDSDVRSWFDGVERDFPRTRLKYIKELGNGWFGRVVEGTALGLTETNEKQTWSPVVVRILEASATSNERAAFLHDAVIYRCGKHANIVQILGRCLESVPLLLLQELCPLGDLKKFLRNSREKPFAIDLPINWCYQLASAIHHLHSHGISHPDLASRNCQLTLDLSIKIGDYGLAAYLYPEDYYQGSPSIPVRWCAPESLTYTPTTIQPKPVTIESNIWSLGVTMWEIYECGTQPYAELSDDDVISQVLGSTNLRLPRPNFSLLYTDYIFRLMQLCWLKSEMRPSASQIHNILSDLLQAHQNIKNTTTESHSSLQDFDERWDMFKSNMVTRTDNHEFNSESISMADVDLSDITVLNMNMSKDDLSNTKPMSPSLNNLHGSLDNLGSGEMDSWLQKVATKTGDMSYVRGLSEVIKDLDDTLALENVSSSDSSHHPSPAPENLKPISKLEFELGPRGDAFSEVNKTQNSSLNSTQRSGSGSETEDENWKLKIERGAYSEKVHQKSKSVTDLMVLTHIDCSESDSETPLPSLDYRVNYRNVRYAPKQNLENVSLMFGSEGNLLSVHDKFQEELKRLQEERKDSLLFVPESVISHNKEELDAKDSSFMDADYLFSSGEKALITNANTTCTYVNINSPNLEQKTNFSNSDVSSPSHRNPESLIEELSSPTDIQPSNQVYNIFNVSVDSNFSPIHIRTSLNDIICFKEPEIDNTTVSGQSSLVQYFQVPKLAELIQNNDDLMDFIIRQYDNDENINDAHSDEKPTISKAENINNKELNNNSTFSVPPNIRDSTKEFLQKEKTNYESSPKLVREFYLNQEEEIPFLAHSTPFLNRTRTNANNEPNSDRIEELNWDNSNEELEYSLESWDNFLGKSFDDTRNMDGFEEFSGVPQAIQFLDDSRILDMEAVECRNEALIESFYDLTANNSNQAETESVLRRQLETTSEELISVPVRANDTFVCDNSKMPQDEPNTVLNNDLENIHCENTNNDTFTMTIINKTFDVQNEQLEEENVEEILQEQQLLDGIYTMKDREQTASGSSNWEPGEGWFLHPQDAVDVSGEMEVSQDEDDSYVGFSMDDEVMAAIRNELLMKLPQAQGQQSETIKDSDDWDSEKRSEVVIKYNVYTTPLSPIPEESYSENDSYHIIYNREDSSDSENGDWPEVYEAQQNEDLPETETLSNHNIESPVHEPQTRHTPSQDSCCSNDTLFNLEDLVYVVNENDLKICEEHNKTFVKVEEETEIKECDKLKNKVESDNNSKYEIELLVEENVENLKGVPESNNEILNEFAESIKVKEESNVIDDVNFLLSILLLSVNEELEKIENSQTNLINETFILNCKNSSESDEFNLCEIEDVTKQNKLKHIENHALENEVEISFENCKNLEKDYIINENKNIDQDSLKNMMKCQFENNIVTNGDGVDILYEIQFGEENEIEQGGVFDNNQITDINAYSNMYLETTPSNKLPFEATNMLSTNEDCESNHYEQTKAEINNLNSINIHNSLSVENPLIDELLSKDIANTVENTTGLRDFVKNNPNYVTEFLKHEQQNYSRDLNLSDKDHVVDINDITITIKSSDHEDPPSYVNTQESEFVNVEESEEHLYDQVASDSTDVDIYDALTDIRFTGPTDIQLMSTSFSESADIDDQDWDSGSDTRSSSSGEFIWKEGEHEESVKALRAAPQDAIAMEKMGMDDVEDEGTSESSDDDEEGDGPEFVPSAWDKYAIPTKSALRSPEKTLEKADLKDKKSKGVWFKKQKYHCVYEYPREPESPNMNNYELWQPISPTLINWEVDTSPYVPAFNSTNSHSDCYQQLDKHSRNLYQLSDLTSGLPSLDDEFFISSTARPFEPYGLSSQFFPGQTAVPDQWMDFTKQLSDNVTPDSGMEDITPASNTDSNEFLVPQKPQVQTLKLLASAALKQTQTKELKHNSKDSLGGLRHARNKLKLDLPPSPSAFTSSKTFTIEPQEEPITKREVPTFTTFGKSRFLVQHVDTPTYDDESQIKNVSFEALPYKPILQEDKVKVEIVRGEASLLDSADEDSGIESSTLERKKIASLLG